MAVYICPTCRKRIETARPADAPYRPFCSKRCSLLDLAKWFNEEYAISSPLGAPEIELTETKPDLPGNSA